MSDSWIISPYLVAVATAWLVAHVIKYIVYYFRKEKRSFRRSLFESGGIPSSHSAVVVSLATYIGLQDGINSGLFGLAALMALIVMYDATKVRRSSGEQGVAIAELIKIQKNNIKIPYVALGHRPIEVIVGGLLGFFIGLIVFYATFLTFIS